MKGHFRHGRPTVGVLAGWEFAWTATPLSYLEPILDGTCRAARELGCNLLLGCGMGSWIDHSESLRPAWPLLSSECDFVPIGPWNTDGLIIVNPLHSEERSRYVQELAAAGHPLVFVAAGEPGPTIVADNRTGILEAMQHLVDHGHRRIALVAGSRDDLEGDSGERLKAFYDAVEAHGLPADPRLVAWGRHVYEGGYRAMREIMATRASFTAVMASNDESALGALRALREAGHAIPQDVAIVGFDDRPESAVQEPPLSSVRIPLRQMGYRAVESLSRYLTGQSPIIEPARVPTRLVVRRSCGCGQDTGGAAAPARERARAGSRGELVQDMAAPIVAEAEGLPAGEAEVLCRRLVDAFRRSAEQHNPAGFRQALDEVLGRVAAAGDDVADWQAALSGLGQLVDDLPAASAAPAREMLDQARLAISASVQRQFRRSVVDQRWRLNRLGTLAARLLAALDESEIDAVLAEHLPAMGVQTAWIGLFGPQGGDAAAWTTLRDVALPGQPAIRFPSHEFPPAGLLPSDRPFGLALFPLTGPRGQLGYVAFDTAQLDLYGGIAQELATALNSAQSYREATEGRRLAEEANRMKSRFLSTVSHELRTPLNLIVGLSGILLRDSDEGRTLLAGVTREDIERLHANAQHLGQLIGDVLDLASSEAGELRLTHGLVDLSQAMGLVVEAGRQLAEDKGLAWQAMLPVTGPWVWGDRTRLRQVALNLVGNAFKFTAQGQVSLSIEPGPDTVTVRVCDTGLGIPPEEQQAIFDEFRRSERSIARGYGGLGLGLAICRRLVELHGGTMGVESSGQEGAGSTFYFTLPIVPPPAPQPVRDSPAGAAGSPHVLVLSRQSGTGERLGEYLRRRGLGVKVAPIDEPPTWQAELTATSPCAVVLDVSVASDEGWAVLKAIKANPATQAIPVLFYTLSQDSGSVLELDYLTKPIELAELTRALDQHWLAADTGRAAPTILVVDDDPSTLEMHARIVQMHSAASHVLKAANGREALAVLSRHRPDLVLLDLQMPELDGFAVLAAMRERESMRDIPVIVVTGQVLGESDMARLNQGVAKVLSKGLFGLDETLAHLGAVLASKRELSGEAQRLVRQAMAYIHEHYAEPMSRQELARHVGLGEDYLTCCFHKELGMTPVAYLNRYRIQQAKQLLKYTHKSITEIALEVGFSSSSYFSHVFQREAGLSPKAFRHS